MAARNGMMMMQRFHRFFILLMLCTWLSAAGGCGTREVALIRQLEGGTEISGTDTESARTDTESTGTDTESTQTDTQSSQTDTQSSQMGTDTGTGPDSDSGDICQLMGGHIRVTEIDVGEPVVANADEAGLIPIAISPLPGGGSRLAWMGEGGAVRITTLNDADQIVRNDLAIPAHDFQDIYATSDGGVLLLTRNAEGGGKLNCGDERNLCVIPDDPIPCFEMYMVRFDDAGEVWTTRLTGTDDIPPYSTAPDGPATTLIWWYAHHGRIASDGHTFAAYFGSAISVPNGGCVDIAQGDRMRVVTADGDIEARGFDWGCSPSGYERIIWNATAHAYVSVCKSNNPTSWFAAFAPEKKVIYNVDHFYANLGELALAPNGGYWLALSDRKPGQPEEADGLAEVHLLQFASDVQIVQTVPSDDHINARAPHVARFADDALVLLYETSETPGEMNVAPERQTVVELRDIEDGAQLSAPVIVPDFTANRYHALRSFDDGSVAMAEKGEGASAIKILRVLPCGE